MSPFRATVVKIRATAPKALSLGALCLAAGCASAARPAAKAAPGGADAALAEAERHILQGQPERAKAALQPALEAAGRSGDRRAEVHLLIKMGEVHREEIWHRGAGVAGATAALVPLERARTLAGAEGDKALLGKAIDGIGMVHYTKRLLNNEGTWQQVDAHFTQAAPLLAGTGEEDTVHFHLGLVRQMRGEDGPARAEFEHSLASATATGDKLAMSYAQRHLGYLAEKRGELERAIELHRLCLANREAVGQLPGSGMAHLAVGELLVKAGRSGEARGHFEKAMGLGRETGSVLVRSGAATSFARFELREKRFDEAGRYAAEAAEVARASHDELGLAEALGVAAEARAAAGDRAGAEAELGRACAIANRGGPPEVTDELDRIAREHKLSSECKGRRGVTN